MGADRIAAILRQCDRAVVMKVGRHLDKVRVALAAARISENAILVETPRCRASGSGRFGRTEQQAPYFSLIIARRKRGQS